MLVGYSSLASGKKELPVYDLESLKKKYPDDLAVYLRHEELVTILLPNGATNPDIVKSTTHEILYLKPASRFYTTQYVGLEEYFEDLISIEVTIIRPDGKSFKLDQTEFSVVDSEPESWVFHDNGKNVVFDTREMGEGYRMVLNYTKRVKHPEFFDMYFFVSNFPIEKSVLKIVYDSDIELKFHEMNLNSRNVKTDAQTTGPVTLRSWTVESIEAYKTDEGGFNMRYYVPHMLMQIVSMNRNGQKINVGGTPEQLHNLFAGFLKLRQPETEMDQVNSLTNDLILNKSSDIEKIDTIFRWVQSNIKYIAFEDGINGYVPRSCSSVMKNRYGDCKDMSALLVEMLRHAGIEESYMAWVGTRDVPYKMGEFPSPISCNHVICVVSRGENSYYYLDATSSETGYILPPHNLQQKDLLIHFNDEKFELFDVPAVSPDSNFIRTKIQFTVNDHDSIFGTGTDFYGGYEREDISYSLSNIQGEDLDLYVSEIALGGQNRFNLKTYEISNLHNKNSDLQLDYTFSVDNLCIKDGNSIIINPALFKPRISKYSVEEFDLPRFKKNCRTIEYIYEITLPAGYQVKSFPENMNFSGLDFNFDGTFHIENNIVKVSLIYSHNLLSIIPGRFDEWNEFSRVVNKATIQNIVLEKLYDK